MVVYPKAADFQKAVFIGTWGDSKIPIYDVPSLHSLNQLVGYVKHINSGNGTVLYRGQCKLYPHVIPSIKHDIGNKTSNDRKLRTAIASAIKDDAFRKFLGLRNSNVNGWEIYQKIITEAAFQHYGAIIIGLHCGSDYIIGMKLKKHIICGTMVCKAKKIKNM